MWAVVRGTPCIEKVKSRSRNKLVGRELARTRTCAHSPSVEAISNALQQDRRHFWDPVSGERKLARFAHDLRYRWSGTRDDESCFERASVNFFFLSLSFFLASLTSLSGKTNFALGVRLAGTRGRVPVVPSRRRNESPRNVSWPLGTFRSSCSSFSSRWLVSSNHLTFRFRNNS